MSAGWKTLDTQNNSLTIDLSEDFPGRPLKETDGRIQSWGWNRSVIGI